MATTSATRPDSKGAVFFRRLISTLGLWLLVLAGLFAPDPRIADWAFAVTIVGLCFLGLREFWILAEQRDIRVFGRTGTAIGLTAVFLGFLTFSGRSAALPGALSAESESVFWGIAVLVLLLRRLVRPSIDHGMIPLAFTLLGLMYVPFLLNFLQRIRYYPELDGSLLTLYLIVVTKFSDVGAYGVGSLIGRHKMIPRISPGKTWEGFGGAIVVSTGLSLLFVSLAGERMGPVNVYHAVALGVILSVSAVIGDLIESLFKREAGVKDSGRLFPGIGGVLDLLDSLLFNAPILFLYWRYVLM